jgi:hypothetical protein
MNLQIAQVYLQHSALPWRPAWRSKRHKSGICPGIQEAFSLEARFSLATRAPYWLKPFLNKLFDGGWQNRESILQNTW